MLVTATSRTGQLEEFGRQCPSGGAAPRCREDNATINPRIWFTAALVRTAITIGYQ